MTTRSDAEMPPIPKRDTSGYFYLGGNRYFAPTNADLYYSALAAAWEARLRAVVAVRHVAEAALERAQVQYLDLGYGAFADQVELLTEVCEALARIGELPPLPEAG